ncbi:hypothetical protein L207DRAFT_508785 [Hyaloscypha variabilis F]|uniref:Uncharacterized protein n=1 Tax=Hyaloscypha variabilis (strain UAMH 11265 / GT02V1 / F) TaxID=1149755 RepID=A0A2J6RZS6_HYAVF|nr:hypothetical protein L207DRAFT_508785 [Hyaloscypha variabilis F]
MKKLEYPQFGRQSCSHKVIPVRTILKHIVWRYQIACGGIWDTKPLTPPIIGIFKLGNN